MAHGSLEYFQERAHFARRLSAIVTGVSLAFLALQGVLLIPIVRRTVKERILRGPLGIRRFGFEGPEQYVQRVILLTSGPPGPNPGLPTIVYRSAQAVKGGRPLGEDRPAHPNAVPDTRPIGQGPGESTEDMVARARILYGGSAPVMYSEDFIIERAVTPTYPPDARDRGTEGRVELVALVDTTGAVARVDVMTSAGDAQLDEAASAAVRQWRFRPYRQDGQAQEVYAVFRFAFRIY
jgi:TonB family protein